MASETLSAPEEGCKGWEICPYGTACANPAEFAKGRKRLVKRRGLAEAKRLDYLANTSFHSSPLKEGNCFLSYSTMSPRIQSSLQRLSSPLSAGQPQFLDFLWGFQAHNFASQTLPAPPCFGDGETESEGAETAHPRSVEKTESEPRSPACPFPLL